MITISELSELTNIKINTIRYWIQKDEYFKKSFFWKEEKITSSARGRKYVSKIYMCDEGDICRIIDYIKAQKEVNKIHSKWTDIAIHCWERKMACKGCNFEYYCSKFTHPPLKKKVLEFVRLYGEPR